LLFAGGKVLDWKRSYGCEKALLKSMLKPSIIMGGDAVAGVSIRGKFGDCDCRRDWDWEWKFTREVEGTGS